MSLGSLVRARRSFSIWRDTVGALTTREAEKRFGLSTDGLLAMLEPFGFILIITSVRYMTTLQPVFGDSIVLFFSTGVVTHFAFVWISTRINVNLLASNSFTRIHPWDVAIAKAIVEFWYFGLFSVAIFVGIWLVGLSVFALPHSPLVALAVVAYVFVMGFGIGLINVAICRYVAIWRHMFRVVVRALIVLSGVMFIPDLMPPNYRYWLSWNPMLHAVAWCRTAFYDSYPVLLLDKNYLVVFALVTFVVGLALEKSTRRVGVIR